MGCGNVKVFGLLTQVRIVIVSAKVAVFVMIIVEKPDSNRLYENCPSTHQALIENSLDFASYI